MLLKLKVQNFAIIEDLEVEFHPGFTVLTGETGAGKSLIIDTISLLLGQRADSEMIRYGEAKALIEGVFSVHSENLKELLEKFGLPTKELVITRELLNTGKNTIKVNQIPISLQMLRQIALLLADVHIQNDTYRLLDPENYLDLITPKNDSVYDRIFSDYSFSYSEYLKELEKYHHILEGQKKSSDRLNELEFEQKEIQGMNLSLGLDEELENSIRKLKNYDKIFSSLKSVCESLENDVFSIEVLYDAAKELSKIKDFDSVYEKESEQILDCYYLLDEIKNHLFKELSQMDFDENELNSQTEQLYEIEKLKKKYHKNIQELLQYLEDITTEIDMVKNYDELLKETTESVTRAYEKLVEKAKCLSDYRKKIAKEIEKNIVEECRLLDLEDTKFEIRFISKLQEHQPFYDNQFTANGTDEVDFLVTFNLGEPLRSLHKVASGGELSRMMLALKSIFLSKESLALMVFDEIDTGVSGSTAKKIAQKLFSISRKTQVLCITHLPQVAAMGDFHLHIYKTFENQRTQTHLQYLGEEERVREIAKMLSGDQLSIFALDHARSLLKEKNH